MRWLVSILFWGSVAGAQTPVTETPTVMAPPSTKVFPENQQRSLLQDVKVSAALDLSLPISFQDTVYNRLEPRGTEIMFYGPIDHIFDGVLSFAAHDESQVNIDAVQPEEGLHAEVHEAYVSSSKLIPNSRFRAGRFFLSIGRLNQFHPHDWPFISAPRVHKEITRSSEGAIDNGFEYSWLTPLPFYLDITFGLTNGYHFGHSHGEERPYLPTHYVHPVTFFSFASGSGIQIGATYASRLDSEKNRLTLVGLDATYKARTGKILSWLFQSELWHKTLDNGDGTTDQFAGAYFYPQYGFDENMALGVRVDLFSELTRKYPATDTRRDNLEYAFVPTFTYKTSEFATFRLAYTHQTNMLKDNDDSHARTIELQFVYLLGAHPSHDF